MRYVRNPVLWKRLCRYGCACRLVPKALRLILILVVLGSAFSLPPLAQSSESDEQACTTKQGLIILVEFPDVQRVVEREHAQKRFFQELNSYVQEMSYGRVCIGGDVTQEWYKMPHRISEYKISPRNLEVDPSHLNNLMQDVLDAVDRDVDFSKYSFVAFFLAAKREDYGMIGLCAYPGMLGWETEAVLKTKSGQVVNGGIVIFCYEAHLGTLFHDVAHVLGGVKDGKRVVSCLYDHDLQSKPGPLRDVFVDAAINMGFWDPMSCHYYRWELPPPGISSWTKIRLNWIDPSKIKEVRPGETTELLLGPLEDGTSKTLAIRIPLSDTTYYLIENRQPIGFDENLPGSGVLIMYGDDEVGECRHGSSAVKLIDANPTIPHLEGAAFDVGKESFVDEKNGISIQLAGKTGNSYRILVSSLATQKATATAVTNPMTTAGPAQGVPLAIPIMVVVIAAIGAAVFLIRRKRQVAH